MARVELRDGGEILGMGGPWMGKLFIDGLLIDDQVMDDALCDEAEEWCLYVIYRAPTRWLKDVRFGLNAVHLPSGKRFSYELQCDMLVLCEVRECAAVIKHAFHKDNNGKVLRVPVPQLDEQGAVRLPWSEIK